MCVYNERVGIILVIPFHSLTLPTCDSIFCIFVESLKVSEGLMEALDYNSDLLEKIHARCMLPLVVC